jgi:coenzyme F420-reducing hydrogenase delta subunit
MSNDYLNHHRAAGDSPPAGTALAEGALGVQEAKPLPSVNVTVFRCVNCAGPGLAPPSVIGPRLSQPGLERPIAVHEVALPCTGKLQPEHLLKAFEAGADAVCVIDCAGDNCQYLEGSQRAERRAEYVGKLLDEIGLGSRRLMVFHLGDSAREDQTIGRVPADPSPGTEPSQEEVGSRLGAICEMVAARLGALPPNPLRQDGSAVWPPNAP